MSKARILIVHPEPSTLALLGSMLKSLEHVINEAANDRVTVRLLERGGIDLVVAAVDPTDVDALELLSYMRRKHRQVPVVLLFATPNSDRAREALRLGAVSVLKYPIPATELRAAVTQALGQRQEPPKLPAATGGMPVAAAQPAAQVSAQQGERIARELGVVGNDPSLRLVIEMAGTIAPLRSPVLIVGEHGTGKSLLARTIHHLGTQGEQPYVTLDCALLSEVIRERDQPLALRPEEGNEAPAEWTAKLALAHGGTLFLDEVATLSLELQQHLLHAQQGRQVDANGLVRGGTGHEIRFLMSTSEDLPALVEQGRFRQDLYHQISAVCLKLSPLRHRAADIEALAETFRARFAIEFGKNVVGFTRDALDLLLKHDWPGNVQELEGAIQRGVVLCQGTRITSGHLAPSLGQSQPSRLASKSPRPHLPMTIRPLKEALEEPEKRIIIQALQALNWNRQETARVLDINRTTLYKKMKKYGLLVDGPIWVN